MSDQDLNHCILRDGLHGGSGDEVLVITDDIEVGKFFSKESKMIGASINVVHLYPETRPVNKLCAPLESSIRSSDIVLTVFKKIPQEFKFRSQIISLIVNSNKPRLAHMPDVDMDIIKNCILRTNYHEIQRLGSLLIQGIARARNVRIVSSNGTNLLLDLGAWDLLADADYRQIETPGTWGNLPLGEVFKIPTNGSAKGTLVVDGAVPKTILSKDKKITLLIDKGTVTDIIDESGARFKEYLDKLNAEALDEEKEGIFKISELGIGINRRARKTCNAIEYEKRYGTIHVALGDNRQLGGDIKAPEHIDMMIESPTLYFDNIRIMSNGKFELKSLINLYNFRLDKYKPQLPLRIKKSTKVRWTKERGSADGVEKLRRYWNSAANLLFDTSIGDEETSRLAKLAWEKIGMEDVSYKDLMMSLGLDNKKGRKLIRMLYDFKIIEIAEVQ